MAEQLAQWDTSIFIFIFNLREPAVNVLKDRGTDQEKKKKSSKPCVLLLQRLHGYLRSNNLFSLHSILVLTNFAL